jgi:CHASE2 domain-containing sensor protein
MKRKHHSSSTARRTHPKAKKEAKDAAHTPSLAIDLRRSIPLVLAISILNFALANLGLLQPLELSVLDTLLRIRATRPDSKQLVIVSITNSDYEKLFKSTSPLDPSRLQGIIQAVASGKPRVIGVDIDTSDSRFKGVQIDAQWPPIVWASVPEESDRDRFTLQPVLGGAPAVLTGVALLPTQQNEVRDYLRRVVTDHGTVDSFPMAVVRVYREQLPTETISLPEDSQNEVLLDFWGLQRHGHRFDTYSASNVLLGARGPGWSTEGILTGKIVLLGGAYELGRDQYQTPVGEMSGTEILAEAIETELHGGGVRPPSGSLLLFINAFVGAALILVYEEWGFATGAVSNVVAALILPPLMSLACFGSTRYSIIFVLMPVAILIERSYEHGKKRRKETLLRFYRIVRRKV